ncbi:transposase [Pseudorhodobacter turbinis]|uniref:Transposase n=1 Tax=Pseudorhodobacter turbinis TaxID=2500533 RepID=A0A4P8ECE6_9RHOB|nr:TniB family NTP-binding protein [Pseudorhodobacter turbinis]QCO54442.1 transposase [Pseudorhodobacter turbinis]
MTDYTKIELTLNRLRGLHVKNMRDDAFAMHLDRLLKRSPEGDLIPEALRFTNTHETRGIMVIDAPGGGKSTMVKRGLTRHPAFAHNSEGKRPFIGATVPSPATLKSMAGHLLELTGYPTTSSRREVWSKWEILKERLILLETTALWIDEAQDLFCADKNQILRAIKSLMQGDSAVIVILSGTEQLADFVRSDPQVQRRFSTLYLPPVDPDADRYDIMAIVEAHCEIAGLSAPIEADLVDRLVHAARRRFGRCIEYNILAIEQALLEGADHLHMHHFAAAWALQEGDQIDRNVFLATDWWQIDPDRKKDAAMVEGRSRRRRAKV